MKKPPSQRPERRSQRDVKAPLCHACRRKPATNRMELESNEGSEVSAVVGLCDGCLASFKSHQAKKGRPLQRSNQ